MAATRSSKNRPSAAKVFLGWVQNLFLLVGLLAVGYYGYVQAEARLFQTYQNWRLDQLQQGKPASFTGFVERWTPFMDDQPPPAPTIQPGPPPANSEPSVHAGPLVSPWSSVRNTEGSLIGRVKIPRLDLSAVVLEGIDTQTLRLAVGHLPGTPLPGEPGTVDLAAHRDTFFHGLRNVRKGDVVTLSTIRGATYQYRVGSIAIVSPNNTDILNSSAGPGINLITCYPFNYVGAAPKRYVVHADEIDGSLPPQLNSRALQDTSGHPNVYASNQVIPVALTQHSLASSRSAAKRLNQKRPARKMRSSLAESETHETLSASEDASPSAAESSVVDAKTQPPSSLSSPSRTNRFRAFFKKIFKSDKPG